MAKTTGLAGPRQETNGGKMNWTPEKRALVEGLKWNKTAYFLLTKEEKELQNELCCELLVLQTIGRYIDPEWERAEITPHNYPVLTYRIRPGFQPPEEKGDKWIVCETYLDTGRRLFRLQGLQYTLSNAKAIDGFGGYRYEGDDAWFMGSVLFNDKGDPWSQDNKDDFDIQGELSTRTIVAVRFEKSKIS